MAIALLLFLPKRKAKYFSPEGWTAHPLIWPSGKSGCVGVKQMLQPRHCEEQRDEAIQNHSWNGWIASLSPSSGAHSRDPLARNDDASDGKKSSTAPRRGDGVQPRIANHVCHESR
jgi:hypothetical protein